MGFTHYWRRTEVLDQNTFKQAAADCEKVTKWLNAPIQLEYDCSEPPIFSSELIRFNGIGEEGHETFYIQQIYKSHYMQKDEFGRYFSFCKTARKEYDTAVTACLVVLKHYFGKDFKVSSDGEDQEWQDGVKACQECLGYGTLPLNREENRTVVKEANTVLHNIYESLENTIDAVSCGDDYGKHWEAAQTQLAKLLANLRWLKENNS